ncbi:hypothetical protein CHGG_03131 [Chaetomium globosum CBS 148.51]|uniref:Uncharacterized protein n=1 Tax=Chaetomium globosum (strain ATCC 6205 / CBS 148.51 / DSM 1962 / NBRC 6347 / NRRL 1970) TaxID=306901 RepID=Q2H9H3_CHAGB|nr:uncharacterized protein CHGG_03131 [Chaetomium globosum CBS 148.51]EAQ91196.1 hypothetical protein CHGG_03131 [Chaetomium globosum CBS 148.51]
MRTFPGCMNLLAVSLTASLPGYEIESASLCGEEHLGISLESGRISVPRMIVAQFDIIRHEYIKELAPKVLQTLQAFVLSCYKDVWFTVFSAVFLLLHQVACTSRDYPLTGSEDVRHGGVTPLAHWQYFKRCDFTKSSNLASSALMSLEQDQTKFLKRTDYHGQDHRGRGKLASRIATPTVPSQFLQKSQSDSESEGDGLRRVPSHLACYPAPSKPGAVVIKFPPPRGWDPFVVGWEKHDVEHDVNSLAPEEIRTARLSRSLEFLNNAALLDAKFVITTAVAVRNLAEKAQCLDYPDNAAAKAQLTRSFTYQPVAITQVDSQPISDTYQSPDTDSKTISDNRRTMLQQWGFEYNYTLCADAKSLGDGMTFELMPQGRKLLSCAATIDVGEHLPLDITHRLGFSSMPLYLWDTVRGCQIADLDKFQGLVSKIHSPEGREWLKLLQTEREAHFRKRDWRLPVVFAPGLPSVPDARVQQAFAADKAWLQCLFLESAVRERSKDPTFLHAEYLKSCWIRHIEPSGGYHLLESHGTGNG